MYHRQVVVRRQIRLMNLDRFAERCCRAASPIREQVRNPATSHNAESSGDAVRAARIVARAASRFSRRDRPEQARSGRRSISVATPVLEHGHAHARRCPCASKGRQIRCGRPPEFGFSTATTPSSDSARARLPCPSETFARTKCAADDCGCAFSTWPASWPACSRFCWWRNNSANFDWAETVEGLCDNSPCKV